MDFVAYMATYVKKEIIPNTLGMSCLFLYISWILLFCLNPEMRSFAYYGIT